MNPKQNDRTIELTLPYTPEQPIPLTDWAALAPHLSQTEQGQLLAKMYWMPKGLCIIDPTALDSIPREAQETVWHILHGAQNPEGSEWRADSPEKLVPAHPDDAVTNGRRYSIIAAAVDEKLSWHLILQIEGQDGALLGPSIAASKPLLFAPPVVSSSEQFVGVHLKLDPFPIGGIADGDVARRSYEASLLLSPALESDSTEKMTSVLQGKVRDLVNRAHKSVFSPTEAKVQINADIRPANRAVSLVINPADGGEKTLVVEYRQVNGILGDYSAWGPFLPFNEKASEILLRNALESSLQERLTRLAEEFGGGALSTSSVQHLSHLARKPISLALQRNGYAALLDSDDVTVHEIRILLHDSKARMGCFHLVASVKRQGKWPLPHSATEVILCDSPQAIGFSLLFKNITKTTPAEIAFYGLRRLQAATSASMPGLHELSCSGLIVSPQTFVQCLETLSSTKPEASPLYAPLISAISQHYKAEPGKELNPQIRKVGFIIDNDPENTDQLVSLLVHHNLGYSRFQICRDKDSGYVSLATEGDSPGIELLGTTRIS